MPPGQRNQLTASGTDNVNENCVVILQGVEEEMESHRQSKVMIEDLLLRIAVKSKESNIDPLFSLAVLNSIADVTLNSVATDEKGFNAAIIEEFAMLLTSLISPIDPGNTLSDDAFRLLAKTPQIAGALSYISGDNPITKKHVNALEFSIKYYRKHEHEFSLILDSLKAELFELITYKEGRN